MALLSLLGVGGPQGSLHSCFPMAEEASGRNSAPSWGAEATCHHGHSAVGAETKSVVLGTNVMSYVRYVLI